jgi:hypothetical protein
MVKHTHEQSNICMTLFAPSRVAIIISNQYIYLFCCRLLGSMYINHLNLVQDDKDHVERGLFLVDDDLYSMLK